MTTKTKLIGLSMLLVLLGLTLHQCNKPKTINTISSNQLKPNEKEEVLYNSVNHQITIKKDDGTTTTEYSRNPVVTIEKNGTVDIQRHSLGFEHSPFLGLSMHDSLRVELGVSWFYYNHWDFNTSLSLTTKDFNDINNIVRGTVSISYNVLSNTNVFVGIDNTKTPVVGVFLRF